MENSSIDGVLTNNSQSFQLIEFFHENSDAEFTNQISLVNTIIPPSEVTMSATTDAERESEREFMIRDQISLSNDSVEDLLASSSMSLEKGANIPSSAVDESIPGETGNPSGYNMDTVTLTEAEVNGVAKAEPDIMTSIAGIMDSIGATDLLPAEDASTVTPLTGRVDELLCAPSLCDSVASQKVLTEAHLLGNRARSAELSTGDLEEEDYEDEVEAGEIEEEPFHRKQPTTQASAPSKPKSSRGLKETRAVGHLIEGPERIESPRPSKNPPTTLVYIRYLVRPFTASQLSKMIESRFSHVSELWLDRIKSSAVVRLESPDLAQRCREGLDGCRWPSINPRVLICDFASEGLLSWLKEFGQEGDRMPPKYLLNPNSEDATDGDSTTGRTHRTCGNADKRVHQRCGGPTDSSENRDQRLAEHLREAEKLDEPARLLDDLFKKTSASPSIYWLPLTSDEAKCQNQKRIAVHSQEEEVSKRRRLGADRLRDSKRDTRSPFANPHSAMERETGPASHPEPATTKASRLSPTPLRQHTKEHKRAEGRLSKPALEASSLRHQTTAAERSKATKQPRPPSSEAVPADRSSSPPRRRSRR